MTSTWHEILVCHTCKGTLDKTSKGWLCPQCAVAYPVNRGVPCMINWALLPGQVRQEMAGQDRHFASLPDKAVFKPAWHPLYQRTRLQQHLGDFVAAIGEELPAGASVHIACCGSGYEAEALANVGYQVSASDLSVQALRAFDKRAAAQGYQVPYLQADVNSLPFADDTFDVVAVVEGLHHTPDPVAAFTELVRIARRRVAVIEPYTGSLFTFLAKLGLAHRREYYSTQPPRLTHRMLGDIVATNDLTQRQCRLYLDLPPHGLVSQVGRWSPAGYLLLTLTTLAELLLRPVGIGNKILWVVDRTADP